MKLTIRRETLTTLTDDGLASVHGASVPPVRIERITADCPSLRVWDCATSIPMPAWTQFCD